MTDPASRPGTASPASSGSPPGTVMTRPGRRGFRRAWAEIDLDAVRHNAALLRRVAAPAQLCAVVKANGYGHGATVVAGAALEAGASWLAVATVEEGVELRQSGISAPVLVLSEPPGDAMEEVVARSLTPTLYTVEGVERAELAASKRDSALAVQLKLDTGMHRVGADPKDLSVLLEAVGSSDLLSPGALWTHLAVADGVDDADREFTSEQLRRFEASCTQLPRALSTLRPVSFMLHAANSAGAIYHPDSRLDMVRCGIALYGSLPSQLLEGALRRAAAESSPAPSEPDLRPVMSLRAEICHVRQLEAGERPSYGRLRPLEKRSVVATVPLGYADGIPRSFFETGGTVLVRGERCPLAGAVTMDQIIVDCGPGSDVSVGDEVVLIGEQGGQTITAWDWANALGTISYEVLSRIGPRVERTVVSPT